MRLSFRGDLCTVRFVGHIPAWTEECFGVEWDDPHRGKHDGVIHGVEYFKGRVPGACSFVKVSKPREHTRTFKEALIEKYTNNETSQIIKLSKNKLIETVGAERFAALHQQLADLETVSLNHMCISGFCEDELVELPNLKRLDLSFNLFESWSVVSNICIAYPSLTSLILNGNRFEQQQGRPHNVGQFLNITEVSLSSTLITGDDLQWVADLFPNVQILNLSNNRLCDLVLTDYVFPHLESLDLSENFLTDAINCDIQNLNLASNNISNVSTMLSSTVALNLAHNTISEWSSVDNLYSKVPNLSKLWLNGNPLSNITENFDILAIARLPTVRTLNGTFYTQSERADSELYFISKVADGTLSYDTSLPRWIELCRNYGEPSKPQPSVNTIKSKLLQLHILHDNTLYQVKVLKTLTIQKLKVMVAKKLGVAPYGLLLVNQHDETLQESRNILYYGLETGNVLKAIITHQS